MRNFKVVIEHDRYSRKPINISFKVSLVDYKGFKLREFCFKENNFARGMQKANELKQAWENPYNLVCILGDIISRESGFIFDTSKGFESFMEQLFEHSTTDFLKEYLLITKNKKDIAEIQSELKKRGEINNEKAICVGSN